MGDPKRHRKTYSKPGHPWQKERIDEEKALSAEYGFKNKKEIWKMGYFLRSATGQAKKLVTLSGPQAEKEKEFLLSRLKRYGLLSPEASLDAILSISLRDVLERRLQTQVYKKNLANSVKQARQFITHEHIRIGSKVITSPSYLVLVSEESQIGFRPSSSISDVEHPERVATRNSKEKKSKEQIVGKEDDKKEARSGKGPNREGSKRDRASKSKNPSAKKGKD